MLTRSAMDSSRSGAQSGRQHGLLLLLIAAGLIGNYLHFPVFLDIDFLFGSVFAMLALQFFGLGRGVVAAALIASYTYILWNQPYAIVILTAEVAAVGGLMKQRKMGMVLADTLYWLVLGLPLAYLFYQVVLDVAPASAHLIMIKQAINGIANALLARLIFTGITLRSGSTQNSFRELIYNLLAFFVLSPALILLALGSRTDVTEADQKIRDTLQQDSLSVTRRLEDWVRDRTRVVLALTEMATTLTAGQTQDRLEQALAFDDNFLRLGMHDTDSIITAQAPAVDQLGRSNSGKKFADYPSAGTLKRTLKPMLIEVVGETTGGPEPVFILLAPVVKQGQYGGYVSGVLRLDQIRKQLERGVQSDTLFYSLVDKNGNIVLTNRKDQKIRSPFVPGKGTFGPAQGIVSRWVPAWAAGTTVSERWPDALHVAETDVGAATEWKLILEQPVAPFQKALYDNYTAKLTLLFVVLLGSLALAEFVSRRIIGTLDMLGTISRHLPLRLVAGDTSMVWPESGIQETTFLIDNFRMMSELLAAQFDEVHELNQTLERRVVQRTLALKESEEKLSVILDSVDAYVYLKNGEGRYLFANRALCELFGASMDEVVGQSDEKFVDAETLVKIREDDRQVLVEGKSVKTEETRVNLKDGRTLMYLSVKRPLRNEAGAIYALCGISTDITERKRLEDQVRQLAFYDPLTKLPNRRLLDDRLRQALAASKRSACFCALMVFDLDNFKPLNDEHGHLAGDLLLIEVARRLIACVREIDTVGRFGGDEFVVMLRDLNTDQAVSTAQAAVVAEKIRLSLSEPYRLPVSYATKVDGIVEHRCTASIGVVVFLDNGATQEDILKRADAAMYQAKAAGRNLVRFAATPSQPI